MKKKGKGVRAEDKKYLEKEEEVMKKKWEEGIRRKCLDIMKEKIT